MKCIAIDDEPLALRVIADHCSKIEFLDLVATCISPVEGVQELNKHEIDLIFLDIQMPNITGLEFVKTLMNPPLIIFTTAHQEHALKGFEVDAVDFLLKPIPFDRFFRGVNKAYEIFQLRQKVTQLNVAPIDTPAPESTPEYLLIKVDYSTVRVNLADILFVEGVKDYVKIVTMNDSYLTKSTMKNLESRLPEANFVRIHKSYIVAIDKMVRIENNRVLYKDKRLPIGEQYKERFNKIVNRYRL